MNKCNPDIFRLRSQQNLKESLARLTMVCQRHSAIFGTDAFDNLDIMIQELNNPEFLAFLNKDDRDLLITAMTFVINLTTYAHLNL